MGARTQEAIASVTSAAAPAWEGRGRGLPGWGPPSPPSRCLWGPARGRMTSTSSSPHGGLPCGKEAQAGGSGQENRRGPGPPWKMTVRDLGLRQGNIFVFLILT